MKASQGAANALAFCFNNRYDLDFYFNNRLEAVLKCSARL